MKTNNIKKVALGLLATSVILGLGMSNVSAMGQGQGLGKYVTSEEKEKLQSMNENERNEYKEELKEKYNVSSTNGNHKKDGNHGNGEKKGKQNGNSNKNIKKSEHGKDSSKMLEGVDKQDLSDIEIDLLQKQYEEEMMANELYTSFYEIYGIETFKNIANSEAQHMEAVKLIFDRYELEVPTNYDHIQDLYEQLKLEGAESEFKALEVGVKIEFVDIDDIVTAIKSTDNDDIKIVLTNIGGASYNHLRGFLNAIENNGYKTDLDYSNYLSNDDLGIRGPIKYKLAERLENDGVTLPENVNSDSLKNKKGEHDKNHGDTENKKGKKQNGKYSQYQDKAKQYKNTIKNKYQNKIDELGEEKLNLILPKIYTILEKIKNNEYSQEKADKYAPILIALKEVIEDTLNNL